MQNSSILTKVISLLILLSSFSLSHHAVALDVTYKKMQFVQAGYNAPAAKYRKYSRTFNQSTTRYIHLDFIVKNLWKGGTHRFFAQAKFYKPNGRLMTSPSLKFIVPKTSHLRSYTLRAGYSTPGLWSAGRYKVKLYFEKQLVAIGHFKVSRRNTRSHSHSSGHASGGSSGGGSTDNPGSSSGSGKGYFPDPQEFGKTGTSKALWQVKNRTAYTLYISYKQYGVTKSVTIKPQYTKNIILSGGFCKIVGTLSKSSITPFTKNKYFKAGTKYRSRFYIKRSKKRIKSKYEI